MLLIGFIKFYLIIPNSMAVVKYSSSIDEIRGKLGNSIYQRCGQSLSIRSNGSVRQSQSADMIETKQNFSSLCQTWRSMTFAQKQSFSDNASTYPTYDGFGNAIILNAFQLFIYINRVKFLCDSTPITTCVPYSVAPFFNIINQSITLSPVSFKFTLFDNLVAPRNIMIYLSEPLNSPNDRQQPNLKFLSTVDYMAAGSRDMSSLFLPSFKVRPVAGQFIWILCRTINLSNGSWVDVPLGSKFVNA